jgi:hypothetical protein
MIRLGVDTLKRCTDSSAIKKEMSDKDYHSGDKEDEEEEGENSLPDSLDGDSLEICYAGRGVPFRRLSKGDVERVIRGEAFDDLHGAGGRSTKRSTIEAIL